MPADSPAARCDHDCPLSIPDQVSVSLLKPSKNLSDIPHMNDEELEELWHKNEPEDFEGWQRETRRFTRPPKKLIQLRLDPRDVRIIDRESKRSGIDTAQLLRSWVELPPVLFPVPFAPLLLPTPSSFLQSLNS